ncbi:hypothetical protein EMIHUDRAFT_458921 [Emiliania huxleyi CCMP1516]|uniref:Plastid lipid-associated protein/fibrillin conserved domain-containing protein n=2 Tax=Emiliania huxleyi TaxID=2903 RepID=A0A0D3J4T5_EMIH1|nr:hypothetical protein EMIHUDRAFT_458921 [Emiliania huxleyi CCMP1516]EOD18520.1 hypothetical protein EMIHUDRAFT_458921 [Emiliania huxleyi CCMP1516]|eukprot:XP_005770949.1 hypothetical protein EMIHUDRAFT_458921 [Emiliania huxleyi CCMP1516]
MLFLLAASPPPLRRAPPVMLSSATTAKSALRAALAASDGEPKAPEVLAAITELEPFSIPEPALSPLWAGDWRVITKPDFPDSLGRDAAGRYKFSLGRASFNMFAPQMLPVAIDSILNPSSAPAPGSPGAYEVIVKLDLLLPDASPLAATMENVAECTPVDGNPGRMAVKFGGGCLRPADGAPSEAWRDTFAAPGSSADLSRMQRFQLWVARRLFGLRRAEEVTADGTMTYEMPRAPEGYLDILFLDEDLRVTRGNRGSIVIAERLPG